MHKKLECDTLNNIMDIVSHITDGLKTSQKQQQIQVGIKSLLGRLSFPSEAGHSMKITPKFYSTVNNNLRCDGVETLVITVYGQLIFPYCKQSRDGGSGVSCATSDGNNYTNRDTVVLGEVDQCYGYSHNGEGYHMHGAPICFMDVHDIYISQLLI